MKSDISSEVVSILEVFYDCGAILCSSREEAESIFMMIKKSGILPVSPTEMSSSVERNLRIMDKIYTKNHPDRNVYYCMDDTGFIWFEYDTRNLDEEVEFVVPAFLLMPSEQVLEISESCDPLSSLM